MRVLVFGGWGQLGSDLSAVASRRGHDLLRPRHSVVDVTDQAAVEAAVQEARPHVVVNAAAFHKTEWCERDPLQAFGVNAVGALNVARAAGAAGARCVYISTDYVFSGEKEDGYAEDDAVAPVNVYGASKVAGEGMVGLACVDSLILRGSGMFGHAGSAGKGGNFVETMLAKAAAVEDVAVVDDLVFAPTSTRDMAGRMFGLLERDAPPGIYHLANTGSCSWFEFAMEIFRMEKAEVALTRRSGLEDSIRRPRCSVLRDTKTAEVGLPPARPWREALRWYLDNRSARAGAR